MHLDRPAADPSLWPLDPTVQFLNHGSFGSCPRTVLQAQQELRDRLERQPIQFLVRDLEPLLDRARSVLGRFLHAAPDDLAFVPNATAGVNTVLRSFPFKRGDELLVTDHEYNACRNALDFAAQNAGARVVVAALPFPLRGPDDIIEAVMKHVTRRTRLFLIDHVTSPTALILPVEKLVPLLRERGVETLVDGAHAPGMVPLNLRRLDAAFYTGNCHKWLCAPKGAAFLHVRRDLQGRVRPLSISHGANSPRKDRSRYLIEFGWTGTGDPSPWLVIPEALQFMSTRLPGGWPAVRRHNHQLAVAARRVLCQALEVAAPCPESMLGSMAALPLPDSPNRRPSRSPLYLDPLQDELLERHGIEVPIIPWPKPPHRLIRVSAQLYNHLGQYQLLAQALPAPHHPDVPIGTLKRIAT